MNNVEQIIGTLKKNQEIAQKFFEIEASVALQIDYQMPYIVQERSGNEFIAGTGALSQIGALQRVLERGDPFAVGLIAPLGEHLEYIVDGFQRTHPDSLRMCGTACTDDEGPGAMTWALVRTKRGAEGN